MTISSAYQGVSVTVAAVAVSRVTVTAMNGAEQEPAPTSAPPPAVPPPPQTDSVNLTRAANRADALLGAVDGDQDGAVSEQEFTDGALALLRRGRSRHLHRRLEKLFDRVDANQDGNVSKAEMTSALERVSGHRRQCPPCAEPPAVANATVTSVTVVAVAMKRYTAAAQTTAA
jgi:hypothetical protein